METKDRKNRSPKGLAEKEIPRLIGIGGAGRRVGCTHFSIMMLNYLTGYKRRKAALLEWNPSGDFERVELICTGRSHGQKPYRVLEGDYFKAAGPRELAAAFRSNYDDILIDFGSLMETVSVEFLRCEKQFLIGSFSEWQEMEFREFVRKNNTGSSGWRYLAAFGSEETRREFKKRPGIFVERIPFSADAFSVTKEIGLFFEALI